MVNNADQISKIIILTLYSIFKWGFWGLRPIFFFNFRMRKPEPNLSLELQNTEAELTK